MRNAWPFLLLLVACASTAVYERGTVRPAPAPLRPGVGAPTVGQPGMRPGAIPRGPYTRVLPPTREPGLWSATPPRASADLGEFILNLPLPASGDKDGDAVLVKCAALAHQSLLGATRVTRAVAQMNGPQQDCIAARILSACAETAHMSQRMQAKPDASAIAAAHVAAAAALRLAVKACDGVDVPDVDGLTREWHTLMWTLWPKQSERH